VTTVDCFFAKSTAKTYHGAVLIVQRRQCSTIFQRTDGILVVIVIPENLNPTSQCRALAYVRYHLILEDPYD